MDRREFIKQSVVAASGMAASHVLGGASAFGAEALNTTRPVMDYVTLNNGIQMPLLGYGTLKLPEETCAQCVSDAIRTGWRLIDTAKNYANEAQVGEGIRMSGIDRKELFITSKLWFKDYGYERAKDAFEATLDRLQLDYLDLYLLHQPFGDVYGAWRALEELYEAGRIRAIGVSNFFPDRLVDLVMNNRIKPAVNQIEINPYFQQREAQADNEEYGVQVEAWGPLCQNLRPELFDEPILKEIGAKYGKTVAQVILRNFTQRGVVMLCKTQHRERMAENLNVFDFKLSAEDMAQIAKVNTGHTVFKDHRSAKDVRWFNTEATRVLK